MFFFHGFPGSRLLGSLVDGAAVRAGARLIAPERPGCGRSDFQAGRTIGLWPADVERLADALGIERFSVVGFSGGGPYAAACAARIPERLLSAGIMSGVAPPNSSGTEASAWTPLQVGYRMARRFPALTESLWYRLGPVIRLLRHLTFFYVPSLPPSDRVVYTMAKARDVLMEDFMEGFRNGPLGSGLELRLLSHAWDFSLADIRIPVLVWHGEEDRSVPPRMGRYLAAAMPHSRPQFFQGEGHSSMLVNRMEEMLQVLARRL